MPERDAATEPDYCTLYLDVGYLKGIRRRDLQLRPFGSPTRQLRQAERHAREYIDEKLAPHFDLCTWMHETPPMIELIAYMLASADILMGLCDDGLRDVLISDATALIRHLRTGGLTLYQRSGRIQKPLSVTTHEPAGAAT